MKNRKAAIGLLVLVLAAGCAFASTLVPKTIYVNARITPNGPITCVNTQRSCEDVGAIACRVQLNVSTGGNATSNTYEDSNCVIPLQDQAPAQVKVSPVTVYQLF